MQVSRYFYERFSAQVIDLRKRVLAHLIFLSLKRIACLIVLNCALVGSSYAQDSAWGTLANHTVPYSIGKSLPTQFSDVVDLDDLKLSCSNSTDFSAFTRLDRYYLVDAPVDVVWNKHLETNLKSAWSGKTINYGFAYSREANEIFVGDSDVVLNPEVGLGFFLELDVLRLRKIPVAFEVSRVDEATKVIQFTYLERNKSNGRQNIVFKNYGEDKTLILHQTYFKSDNNFRDRRLYPPFHRSFIDQYHDTILKDRATFKTVSRRKMRKKFASYRAELCTEVKNLENNNS